MFQIDEYTFENQQVLSGLPIDYGIICPAEPTSAVVLMPSARTALQTDRSKPYFPRWSWAPRWPNSLVMTIADPVLAQFPELDGGWFIHREHDVLAAIAAMVADIIAAHEISPDRVTFYGSSLGGYGAIGAAAHLRGSRAVAEVPHVSNWMPRFVSDIETIVLQQSMGEFRKVHPERICLQDRILVAGFIPPIHMITNSGDYCIADQRRFIEWARSTDLPRSGDQVLEEAEHLNGHKVLTQDELVGRFTP